MSVPARRLNAAPSSWAKLAPAPKLSLPGLALACAMSSGTDFTGTPGFTASANGFSARKVIPAKSFTGS